MYTFEDPFIYEAFIKSGEICGVFCETPLVNETVDDTGYVTESRPVNFLGYFGNHQSFCKEIFDYPNKFDYHGNKYWLYIKTSGQITKSYIFYNRLSTSLLMRSQNSMKTGATGSPTNPDITRILKVPFDIDPILPARYAGCPSTDEELDWTKRFREELLLELEEWGFDDLIQAMSGNGSYGIASVDWPTEDFRFIKRFMQYLAGLKRFDKFRMHAKLDTNVTPRQMCKLFGSLNKKGKQVKDVPKDHQRLWRVCYIESLGSLIPAGLDVLNNLKLNFPDTESTYVSYIGSGFDLEEWLFKWSVVVKQKIDYDGSYRYILECCPFCGHGKKDECYLLWTPGPDQYYPKFVCPHPSCDSLRFKQYKLMIERGYYDEI